MRLRAGPRQPAWLVAVRPQHGRPSPPQGGRASRWDRDARRGPTVAAETAWHPSPGRPGWRPLQQREQGLGHPEPLSLRASRRGRPTHHPSLDLWPLGLGEAGASVVLSCSVHCLATGAPSPSCATQSVSPTCAHLELYA